MAAPMPRVPPVTTATLAIGAPLFRPFPARLLAARYPIVIGRGGSRIYFLNAFEGGQGAGAPARLTLDGQRNAHAAADTQSGETLLCVALAHFMQERHKHARARSADRMADRNGAAVDVHNGRVPAHVLVARRS